MHLKLLHALERLAWANDDDKMEDHATKNDVEVLFENSKKDWRLIKEKYKVLSLHDKTTIVSFSDETSFTKIG